MQRIRYFEEEVTRLRAAGDVVGSVHLCDGQEAVYVGACAALDLTRDAVFPTYRGHGWTLACGAPPHALFAELLGRATGVNGGRGGSAYLTAPQYGMYGENSIVGAGAPIATGAALAATFDGSGRVALAAFGDGAMNQGAVHEAMNFAAVRSLPVVFLIENNSYSELTPIADMVRVDRLYKRASAYGIPGARIDGNDPSIVQDAVAEAARRARAGEGPVVLEAMTQRIVGHYIGDVQHYRPAGDLERAQAAEPIGRLVAALTEQGVPASELDALSERVRDEIAQASARALADPLADPSTVLEHLYA
ncbi:thiamine pyrophosphate-dependent dehydrogenase E1 component subunit alpha [Actinomadura roseirufa]|uniref:thiamine pyrophosphate-dependent dehydrogenase E1 component subunit alpha n=1 Tax=Actinomadura roseirufa TaxID=2094049 RepID=UPI001F5E6CDC|nr:thiamine pyrophosphate-dependent dehydrogenase E1 component subunit alpha [Actinomadura roseirufa]